jgi:hypothetical protein
MLSSVTIKNPQLWESLMADELHRDLSPEQRSTVSTFKSRCEQNNWQYDCISDRESILILAA